MGLTGGVGVGENGDVGAIVSLLSYTKEVIVSTRYNSSGRVQPIEYRNLASPGECLLCKRIGYFTEEVFANLQVELDFYGLLYMCQNCCLEMADFVNAIPEEQHAAVVRDNTALLDANARLSKKIEYLKGLLDARIDSIGSSEPNSNGPVGVPVPEVESDTTFVDQILK